MDLHILETICQEIWSMDTCYPACRDQRSENNAALWQCAITSLLIQDYFGGNIVYNQYKNHYRNIIDGCHIDFTLSQFKENDNIHTTYVHVTRDDVLSTNGAKKADTYTRYMLLKSSVEAKK